MEDRNKILVVDDDFFGRTIIEVVYQSKYTVLRAENGIAALNVLAAEANHIAFIILDLFMPAMDGFEFLEKKQMDSRYADIPVLVVTAATENEKNERAVELGADMILQKPLDPQKLTASVTDLLKRKEQGSVCSEQLKQELIDHVNNYISGGVCCTLLNDEQEIYYISPSFAEYLGYTGQKDMLHKKPNWRDHVVHEDYYFAEAEMRYQLEQQGEYVVEYHICRKDGTTVKMRDFGRYSVTFPEKSMIIRLCVQVP